MFDQTAVPSDLTNAVGIARGLFPSLALRGDGTVVVWGENRFQENEVPPSLKDVVSIAAADNFCLAARRNGEVLAWSSNTWGAIKLPAGLTNIVAVAAGSSHSLALRADGTVVAWGPNTWGENNVPNDLTNVVAVAGGASHSLALKADGSVVAWGANYAGQIAVPLGLTNAIAIAAGSTHSLALRADGTVVVWGDAAPAPASLTQVVAVAGGSDHHLALRLDGTVTAWGRGVPGDHEVSTGLRAVVSLAAARGYSLALVGVGSPVLTSPLTSRTAIEGGTVYFRMTASGELPLSYQWRFKGALLPGANQSVLVLTNLERSQAGLYSVTVRNAHGEVTSDAAPLSVIPLEARILSDSLQSIDGHIHFEARTSPAGTLWRVEASTDLIQWRYVGSVSSGSGLVSFRDPVANSLPRFYRMRPSD